MILKADIETGRIYLKKTEDKTEDKKGTLLPGILQSLSINGDIVVDSSNSVGNKTPSKTSRGFKDKTVSMSLLILPDAEEDVYSQLERLEQLFHKVNEKEPEIFTFTHKHIAARNITTMLFQSFSSSESGSENMIHVSLHFEQFHGAGKAEPEKGTEPQAPEAGKQ